MPYLPVFSPFQTLSRRGCNFVRLEVKKSLKTKIHSIGSSSVHLTKSLAPSHSMFQSMLSIGFDIVQSYRESIFILDYDVADSDSIISIDNLMIWIPIALIQMCNLMIWFSNLMIENSIVCIFSSIR